RCRRCWFARVSRPWCDVLRLQLRGRLLFLVRLNDVDGDAEANRRAQDDEQRCRSAAACGCGGGHFGDNRWRQPVLLEAAPALLESCGHTAAARWACPGELIAALFSHGSIGYRVVFPSTSGTYGAMASSPDGACHRRRAGCGGRPVPSPPRRLHAI